MQPAGSSHCITDRRAREAAEHAGHAWRLSQTKDADGSSATGGGRVHGCTAPVLGDWREVNHTGSRRWGPITAATRRSATEYRDNGNSDALSEGLACFCISSHKAACSMLEPHLHVDSVVAEEHWAALLD